MHAIVILLLFACGAPALADGVHEHAQERVEHAMGEDRVVAGARALADGAVAGDLILAGGEVVVVAPVGGDLVAAGGNVRIDAEAGQDLYAAGGSVALDAAAKRNVRLAGGKIEVGSRATIAGNATLAGGSVIVLGNVAGHLAVAGGRVFLNGRVQGDVSASGGEIELGPNAHIAGELRYRSPADLKRAAGSEVLGGVFREPQTVPWGGVTRAAAVTAGAFLAIWTLGMMAMAGVFVAVLPRFTLKLSGTARSRPGMSLLVGFAALFATPPVAGLLLATGIGLPLGVLLWIAYGATLLIGLASMGVVVGQYGLQRLQSARADRTGWRVAAAGVAYLLLSLLGAIPVLGWLAWFAAWLMGMGAFLLQLRASAQAAG